jgi:hypothetical protein
MLLYSSVTCIQQATQNVRLDRYLQDSTELSKDIERSEVLLSLVASLLQGLTPHKLPAVDNRLRYLDSSRQTSDKAESAALLHSQLLALSG